MCEAITKIRNSISREFEFSKLREITNSIWNLCYLICMSKRHIETVRSIYYAYAIVLSRTISSIAKILGKVVNVELSKIRHCCDNIWERTKVVLAYGEPLEVCQSTL